MNNIELKWTRFRGDRFFDDILIDGRSLRDSLNMGDFISPFGWLSKEAELWFAENLLLKNESELGGSRFPILLCSECADLGCGTLTAEIKKTEKVYIWDYIGFQNDYEDEINIKNIGPFEFSIEEYESIVEGILNRDRI